MAKLTILVLLRHVNHRSQKIIKNVGRSPAILNSRLIDDFWLPIKEYLWKMLWIKVELRTVFEGWTRKSEKNKIKRRTPELLASWIIIWFYPLLSNAVNFFIDPSCIPVSASIDWKKLISFFNNCWAYNMLNGGKCNANTQTSTPPTTYIDSIISCNINDIKIYGFKAKTKKKQKEKQLNCWLKKNGLRAVAFCMN